MNLILKIALLFLFLANSISYADGTWNNEAHSQLRLVSASPAHTDSLKLTLGVHFVLDPGWKIYWKIPGDTGFPTAIKLANNNIVKPYIHWPIPSRDISEEGIETFTYQNEFVIPFDISFRNKKEKENALFEIDYLICNTSCIPVTTQLKLENAVQNENIIQRFVKKVPRTDDEAVVFGEPSLVYENGHPTITLKAYAQEPFIEPDLIITEPAPSNFAQPMLWTSGDNLTATFYVPIKNSHIIKQLQKIKVVLLNNKQYGVEKELFLNSSQEETPIFSDNILFILFCALAGGLILNVMPCVLPVLSLKILALINHSSENSPAQIKKDFAANAAGVIVSFLLLAILTCIFKGLGKIIGFGLHFSDPSFLITLIIILVVFACNLLGAFEFILPSSWLNRLNLLGNSKSSLLSNFLSGMLATILATPCTAPFVGTAVSFALSRGNLETISIFTLMGVGMALPYILLYFFPKTIFYLPKPGKWMVKVRQLLGIMLFATVLWLIFIVSSQLGNKAAFLLFLICLLLKFVLENNTLLLKFRSLKAVCSCLIIAAAFYIPFNMAEQRQIHQSHINIIWQQFDQEKLNEYVKQGKTVVVDVTADWCLICKMNKLSTLERESTLDYFRQHDIVAMRADLTNHDPNIIKYLHSFNRFGIPLNVVYGPKAPQGIVLPELLSTSKLLDALSKAGAK
jgi:suppressor for copper-sensitivity B